MREEAAADWISHTRLQEPLFKLYALITFQI